MLEDLKTSNMTRKSKPKQDKSGKYLKNNKKQKSGLNKSILDKGWFLFEVYLMYKSHRAGKAWFKISAYNTSLECACCGHTHPLNRKTQELFSCRRCGHTDNADHNAAEVIKKRAIKLILYSGTELSNRGILLDKGRGAINKTCLATAKHAQSNETSKKKVLAKLSA